MNQNETTAAHSGSHQRIKYSKESDKRSRAGTNCQYNRRPIPVRGKIGASSLPSRHMILLAIFEIETLKTKRRLPNLRRRVWVFSSPIFVAFILSFLSLF